MTYKQIIIDYENICENYNKEVGCYYTFYGSCNKEQCFTYRLLQLLQAKEQECEELKQTLAEIKEIAEKHKATAHCDYLIDMDKILQKISEVR